MTTIIGDPLPQHTALPEEQEDYSEIEQAPAPQPTTPSITDQEGTDYIQLELPSGFKLVLGSKSCNVYQLCDLALQMKDRLSNNNHKEVSYTG